MSTLVFRERPAAGDPRGLLVLHHGRGADERDLLLLGDALDPQRELHVVTPRAPLTLPGWSGYHWYGVPRVGHPDEGSFHSGYRELADFHDELFERTGIAPSSTVFGGFSMGSVMSYALGLGADRNFRGQLSNLIASATLEGATFTHEIDNQAAHHASGIAHEPLAIGKHRIAIRHAQIGLMQQRSRADRSIVAAPQLAFRKST